MDVQRWLTLTDYASKHRVSISTLRRRIKSGQMSYRFDDGKYLVLDEEAPAQPEREVPTAAAATVHRAIAAAEAEPSVVFAEGQLRDLHRPKPPPAGAQANLASNDEPILSSASRLLSELKRAYMNILQEKEEQMIQLKEEVVDLKTLVRVLEDDNDRLRRLTEGR